MKRLAFKHLLVFTSLVLASTSQVRAENEEFESPKQARFSYAVKFVCMSSSEEVQEGVVKGVYATDINVHNPSLGKRAIFFKKVAQAFPYQKPGPVSKFQRGRLGPNEAMEVECNEIRQRLPRNDEGQLNQRMAGGHFNGDLICTRYHIEPSKTEAHGEAFSVG